jgi:hypothetical protein
VRRLESREAAEGDTMPTFSLGSPPLNEAPERH